MYNLKEAFESLHKTLKENMISPEKNFWQLYFAWWRFFYCFNENLEHTEQLKDKIVMIDDFITYNKQLTEFEAEVLERNKLTKDKLPSMDTLSLPPAIRNLQLMLKKEQSRSMKLVRQVKREKVGGKAPTYKGRRKNNRLKA